MLTVLVLVCSMSVTPDYLRNCDRNNAVQVMQLPEPIASPSMCAVRGQAYLAQMTIGQELATDERVKVLCIKSGNVPGNVG
jgi:hypothetical protein